jgi:succinoglycan biosynthesis protein ExoM
VNQPLVSLIIPTQRRPEGLALAARSALAQAGAAAMELVIVDNDEAPSAEPFVRRLAAGAPCRVIYVHEPRAGVANARNAGLAHSAGDLIAFLDDDEEAPAGWLAALLATQAAFHADAVFGPVRARLPQHVRRQRAYFERFFSRIGPAGSGVLAQPFGCGNSMVRRAALPKGPEPFSAARNQIGGEDNLLFQTLADVGARFAWAAAAWVWEDPAPARLTLGYTLRRAFAYGQAPTSDCAARSPVDAFGVARWMVQGLLQAAAFGLVAALRVLFDAPEAAEALDLAARGLGKTFWGGPFRIAFYGLPASRSPRAVPAGVTASATMEVAR